MGFFDQRPAPPPSPPEPDRPAWARPDTVLPGVVADTLVLARTADTVVALSDLRVYPNGVQLNLMAVVRAAPDSRRSLASNGPRRHDGALSDEFLRFGLRFADGTVLTNLDNVPAGPDRTEPLLLREGGHSTAHRSEQTFWVSPLPPPGRIDMVCQWPARGIPETVLELDAGLILTAAQHAVTLF